jgi:Flp pilus assembly protein TadG
MRKRFFHNTDGQMMLMFAFYAVVLILFAGIALDMGLIYMTKARLGNAVDSAVLTAAKNYSQGTATAQNLGQDMFYANFGTQCGTNGITCTWTFCPGAATCSGTAISAQLYAQTTIDTTFLGYLPALKVWHLGDTGAATQSTLVMTIILDRSGSMSSDGGGTALQSAVPSFVADWTQNVDYLALVSFASHSTINVAITTTFSTPIDDAVADLDFTGGTFGGGAGSGTVYSTTNGPPLNMADTQNANGVALVPANQPYTKVIVYFTDGLMNVLQDQFSCVSGKTSANTVMNYGGADPTSPGEGPPYPPEYVVSLNPTSETYNSNYCYDASGEYCTYAYLPEYSTGTECTYNSKEAVFPSEEYPTQSPLAMTRWNVSNETKYRAKYTANQIRSETPGTYIFTIGLGTSVSGDACTEAFLATLANDPNAASYTGGANCDSGAGVYNASEPAGQFFVVPDCPSSTCTQELNQAFQDIAAKIALRLSQ